MAVRFIPGDRGVLYVKFGPHNCPMGELCKEVDGYYVWYPDVYRGGYWSEWLLRAIADKLRELNKEWHEQVCRDMDAMKTWGSSHEDWH